MELINKISKKLNIPKKDIPLFIVIPVGIFLAIFLWTKGPHWLAQKITLDQMLIVFFLMIAAMISWFIIGIVKSVKYHKTCKVWRNELVEGDKAWLSTMSGHERVEIDKISGDEITIKLTVKKNRLDKPYEIQNYEK